MKWYSISLSPANIMIVCIVWFGITANLKFRAHLRVVVQMIVNVWTNKQFFPLLWLHWFAHLFSHFDIIQLRFHYDFGLYMKSIITTIVNKTNHIWVTFTKNRVLIMNWEIKHRAFIIVMCQKWWCKTLNFQNIF